MTRTLALAALIVGLIPASANAASCKTERWVGSWAAAPSSASRKLGDASSVGDVSLNVKLPVTHSTTRSILTPTLAGRSVRVTLSNRFGTAPVTFSHVAIGRSASGAALAPGTSVDLTFAGKPSVAVAAGQDVTSDAATFSVAAGARTAVSVYVDGDAGKPTEHYTARQTSYLTLPGTGDHVADEAAAAFSNHTTARPWVSRLDVQAPTSTGAVLAFGDSITDGYQSFGGQLIPEDAATVDKDARYTDALARRLAGAGTSFGVLNEGISGNRILGDGGDGGLTFEGFGPAALKRIDADTPTDANVTTVLFLEGINDISAGATADQIIAGYRTLIERWHGLGLRVLQGTLEPNGAANAVRDAVNAWIRTQTTADGVIDFDAAVRDPANPNRIAAAYDGGDQLHYSPAGYVAMAAAVPLDQLAKPTCGGPLRVKLSTRHLTVRRRTTLRVTVTRDGAPLAGATARLGTTKAKTNAAGVAKLRVRPAKAGLRTLTVSAPDAKQRRVRVRVRRAG